jgi:pyruvate,water dikinase
LLFRLPSTVRAALARDPGDRSTDEFRFRADIQRLEERCDRAAGVSDGKLIALVQDTVNLAAELTRLRFLHYLLPMMVRRTVATALIRAARMTESITAEDLLADLDHVTAVVGREIVTLRSRAERDGLGSVLRDDDDPRGALLESARGRDFLREFDASLARIGASTSSMYLPFSSRSWRERPRQLLDLIGVGLGTDHVSRPLGTDTQTLVGQRLPRFLRRRWALTVKALRDLHIGREGTLYLIEEIFVIARRGMDEIAGRLVDRGVLADAEDIRFATFEEVQGALLDCSPATLKRTVSRRKRLRGRAEASWWDRGLRVDSVAELRGLAASPGRAMGVARVIDGPTAFGDLRTGDVLVCRFTDPTWTPLFALAAAVVADAGGPLSHAAIVAREYGIPAVLGAVNATTRLTSGQRILVDGDCGTVEILASTGSV